MSESFQKPRTLAEIAPVEGSQFAKIESDGDRTLIDTAVAEYLRKQTITSAEEFAERANNLREQFAEPQTLAQLKGRSFMGQKFHSQNR